MNIEDIKESEYCVYIVRRRPWHMYLPDTLFDYHVKLNVGQYEVEEVYCPNEDALNKTISNFSHILEDDNNALITNSRNKAYFYMCCMNRRVNEEIENEVYSRLRDSVDNPFNELLSEGISFEKEAFSIAENIIEARRSKK